MIKFNQPAIDIQPYPYSDPNSDLYWVYAEETEDDPDEPETAEHINDLDSVIAWIIAVTDANITRISLLAAKLREDFANLEEQ